MTIGDRIRQARIENGMTQKDLAEKLGVSYQNISQYERGVKQPKMETIEKIANALGADAYYIRTGDVADLEEAVMTKIRKVDPQLEKVLQKLNTDDRNLFFSYMAESITKFMDNPKPFNRDEAIAELVEVAKSLDNHDLAYLLGAAEGLALSRRNNPEHKRNPEDN